ncbi:MAG: hypothetical protein ACO1RX_04410 [Candidatus Sericytochromatia bacterium]
MQKYLLTLCLTLGLGAGLSQAAHAQFLVGPSAELGYVRGPNFATDPADSKPGLLVGLYAGASGFELRPAGLIVEGQYRGFVMDAGIRMTPKWFGQEEYLFNFISPYAVLAGSIGYPWSVGWNGRLGLGVALMEYGSINAELGYRSHRLDESTLLEGVTVGLRATFPF